MRNFKGKTVTVYLLTKSKAGWGFQILTEMNLVRVYGVPKNISLYLELERKNLHAKDVKLAGCTIERSMEIPAIFLMEKTHQAECPLLDGDHHFVPGAGGRYIPGKRGNPKFPMTFMQVEGEGFTWTFWSPDHTRR